MIAVLAKSCKHVVLVLGIHGEHDILLLFSSGLDPFKQVALYLFVVWDVENRKAKIVSFTGSPRANTLFQCEEIPAKLPFYGLPWSLPALHLGVPYISPNSPTYVKFLTCMQMIAD